MIGGAFLAEAMQFAMMGSKTSLKSLRLFRSGKNKCDMSAGNKMAKVHCLFGFSLDVLSELPALEVEYD